jgi:hypothetical protein
LWNGRPRPFYTGSGRGRPHHKKKLYGEFLEVTQTNKASLWESVMSICYEFALDCKLKRDVSQEVIDTLAYMTRSQEYDFEPKLDGTLFKETSAWKRTVEMFGHQVTVIEYNWETILTNYPREGEQYLPGEFTSTFQNNQLSCRRLVRDDVFNNIWWLLLPWLASISESTGFVGYYRSDFDDYLHLIYFADGKASVYEQIVTESLQFQTLKLDKQEIILGLNIHLLSYPVKQEIFRRAKKLKMSIEVYTSLVIAKKVLDGDILLNLYLS